MAFNTTQQAITLDTETDPQINMRPGNTQRRSSKHKSSDPEAYKADSQKDNQKGTKTLKHMPFGSLLIPAMNCLPGNETSQNTLSTLYLFLDEIKKPNKKPEIIALRCLKAYRNNPSFLVDSKELQKFLPNINIKREERLLKLFGVEILDVKDPKDATKKLYTLAPYKYVRATMINSVSSSNIKQRIQFAFQMYDQDGDGRISHKDLRELFTFYGKESQFALTNENINDIVDAISQEIEKDNEGMISFQTFQRFFKKFEGTKAKLNIFERGRAESPTRRKKKTETNIEINMDTERSDTTNNKPQESFKTENSPGLSSFLERNDLSTKKLNASFQLGPTLELSQMMPKKPEIALQLQTEIEPLPLETNGERKMEENVEEPEVIETTSRWVQFKNKIIVERAKWIWLCIWIIGAVYEWVSHFLYYYHHTGVLAVGIAKGCAAMIYYNMGVMFFLITKSITTVLRKIHLAHLLPLNFNVYFHRLLGMTTMLCGLIHTICHVSGSYRALASFTNVDDLNKILYTPVDEVKSYTWWLFQSVPSITGIISLIMMALLVIFALKKNRRKNYERFWYSHLMWFALLILLSLHGSKQYIAPHYFMYWVGFPSIILIIEKVVALFSICFKKFKILDLAYISSDLIELKVSKPKSFQFRAGQYGLINIKQLSPIQWHPFSYSSGPSDDFITFHISPVGDWTKGLKELAINYKKDNTKLPTISLMGPYGAPSQHYKDFKKIMIFCTGVGATPFSSILREFIHKALQDEKLDEYSIDFYWMCRNPSHHGWLSKLFLDLQAQQKGRDIVKLNMFFTSPHERFDLRMFLFWIGLNKLYEKGVRVKGLEHFNIMHWGKPNWDDIFTEKKREIKKGNVGVFFCGNSFLAKEIHQKCCQHSKNVVFKFSKEIF